MGIDLLFTNTRKKKREKEKAKKFSFKHFQLPSYISCVCIKILKYYKTKRRISFSKIIMKKD